MLRATYEQVLGDGYWFSPRYEHYPPLQEASESGEATNPFKKISQLPTSLSPLICGKQLFQWGWKRFFKASRQACCSYLQLIQAAKAVTSAWSPLKTQGGAGLGQESRPRAVSLTNILEIPLLVFFLQGSLRRRSDGEGQNSRKWGSFPILTTWPQTKCMQLQISYSVFRHQKCYQWNVKMLKPSMYYTQWNVKLSSVTGNWASSLA